MCIQGKDLCNAETMRFEPRVNEIEAIVHRKTIVFILVFRRDTLLMTSHSRLSIGLSLWVLIVTQWYPFGLPHWTIQLTSALRFCLNSVCCHDWDRSIVVIYKSFHLIILLSDFKNIYNDLSFQLVIPYTNQDCGNGHAVAVCSLCPCDGCFCTIP